jgi:hypothetical protein
MKTIGKHAVIVRIERKGLLLAGILVLVFVSGGIARAQSSGSSPALPSAEPSAVSASAKPAPNGTAQRPAAPAPDALPPSKAAQEGLKVHGHWTIEVRNPDGSVDKHLEFENSLCPPQTTVSGVALPGGALALSLLVTGQATPGAWMIVLGDKSTINKTAGAPPGCPNMENFIAPTGGYELFQNTLLAGQAEAFANICGTSCFTNLVVATSTATSPSITLSGQIPAAGQSFGTFGTTQNLGGEIDTVSAGNVLCMNSAGTISTAQCPGFFPQSSALLTGTQLASPVTWTAGQAVAVTVVISFGSN